MNIIKVISFLLIPMIAFSYSYFCFINGSLQSSELASTTSSLIQENIITKLATSIFAQLSVNATVNTVFVLNRNNELVLDITFDPEDMISPTKEFDIFYSLLYTIFFNFPSIDYIRFVNPVFIKYVSTKETIVRGEVKYENK